MEQRPTTYTVDAAAIRNTRMSLGLTIDDLAAAAGISRSYLNQLELGIKRHMRPPTYTALCRAAGIPPGSPELLDHSEDPHERTQHGAPDG